MAPGYVLACSPEREGARHFVRTRPASWRTAEERLSRQAEKGGDVASAERADFESLGERLCCCIVFMSRRLITIRVVDCMCSRTWQIQYISVGRLKSS